MRKTWSSRFSLPSPKCMHSKIYQAKNFWIIPMNSADIIDDNAIYSMQFTGCIPVKQEHQKKRDLGRPFALHHVVYIVQNKGLTSAWTDLVVHWDSVFHKSSAAGIRWLYASVNLSIGKIRHFLSLWLQRKTLKPSVNIIQRRRIHTLANPYIFSNISLGDWLLHFLS